MLRKVTKKITESIQVAEPVHFSAAMCYMGVNLVDICLFSEYRAGAFRPTQPQGFVYLCAARVIML